MKTHELAGQTVKLNSHSDRLDGAEFRIEDYWINVSGGVSWMNSNGNPACLQYAMRGLPIDDDVLYGKVGSMGVLVHVSELGEVVVK